MKDKLTGFLDKAIAVCFYLIFFFVPLVMSPSTSELFEFNKMWVVFGLTLLIMFFWATKAIHQGKFEIKKTPLDLPILLFLASQILSTIFSIDKHVSIWGYYSRFNGGLLSILSYIGLYYAFTTNFGLNKTERESGRPVSLRILLVSLVSGLAVSLWGIPSHFGFDPTCLVFRGSFDVSCWTDAFQPKVRIFSTLGQPNWLAAYLAVLIPVAIGFAMTNLKSQLSTFKLFAWKFKIFSLKTLLFAVLAVLFFVALIYSGSQSGFLALIVSLIFFSVFYFLRLFEKRNNPKIAAAQTLQKKFIIGLCLFFLIILFFIGDPITALNKFTFRGLKAKFSKTQVSQAVRQPNQILAQGELGGTDSGKIRLIVWRGALKIFAHYPLFGSGIETFAFSYYKYKPIEHNLTSEWDYLYNKAHNEYLNYLATTGLFGLGSYLLLTGMFLNLAISNLKSYQSGKPAKNLKENEIPDTIFAIFPSLGLLSAYISILISNFFGFSVVIVNLFLFLIPAFFFDINGLVREENLVSLGKKDFTEKEKIQTDMFSTKFKDSGMLIIIFLFALVLYLEIILIRFWLADKNYALGNNYDKVGYYPDATAYLRKAVDQRPGEDIFKDELAVNLSIIAALESRTETTKALELAIYDKKLLDEVIKNNPNNVIFYRSRTKALYALAQVDKKYFTDALETLNQAQTLAPTDAKIAYNLGLLYGINGQTERAREALKKSIYLKSNYADPRQSLAVLDIRMATQAAQTNPDFSGKLNQEAKDQLNYILTGIDPSDTTAKSLLESLK